MPMKILILCRNYPDIICGVGDNTFYLSKALSERGFNVSILTSKDKKIITEVNKNIDVIPVIEKWSFRHLPKIIREIKLINPDWIFLQYVPQMYNPYAVPFYLIFLLLILRTYNFKILVIFHEVAIRLDWKKPKYWVIAIIQRIIAYLLCFYSQKVVTSIEKYSRMLYFFSSKITIIPVGSSISQINIYENDRSILKQRLTPSGEFLISTFGCNPKNNHILFDALKKITQEGIPTRLLLIGFSNEWINKMKKKADGLGINDKIIFTGILNRSDIYRFLCISDLFITLEELDYRGWGGISIKSSSVASAFAAGLPILSNRGDMTGNFFRHGENAYLINSIDLNEIVSGFKTIFLNRDLLMHIKKGAEKTFKNQLDWPVLGGMFTKIIQTD